VIRRVGTKLLESEPTAPAAKTATKRKPAKRRKPRATAGERTTVGVRRWAAFGVGLMLVLSAALNGFANAQHSPVAWAGWMMGLAVPVIVLTLAKVAGEKYRAGQKPVAWFDTREDAAARFLKVSGLQGIVDPEGPIVDHGLTEADGRWRLAMDPGTFGLGAPDMPKLIAESKAEVVLARGERDPMNTDEELRALHDQVVTLPGLGHNAHVEDPAATSALSTR